MPRNPRKQRCTHPGCRAWAKRGYHLCAKHLDPAALPLLAPPPVAPPPVAPPPPDPPVPANSTPSPPSDQESLRLFVAMCRSGFPGYSIPFLAGEELQKAQGTKPSVFDEEEGDDPNHLLELEAAPVIQHFFARCIEICDFAIRQMRTEVAAERMDPLYAAEQCARLGAHLSRILAAAHSVRPDPDELRARRMRAIREQERKEWEEADPALRGPLPRDLLTPKEERQRERESARKWEAVLAGTGQDESFPESAESDLPTGPSYESLLRRIL